jgi:hypothetical protein
MPVITGVHPLPSVGSYTAGENARDHEAARRANRDRGDTVAVRERSWLAGGGLAGTPPTLGFPLANGGLSSGEIDNLTFGGLHGVPMIDRMIDCSVANTHSPTEPLCGGDLKSM